MLLAESVAVIGWCFSISQSQPCFLLKAFSWKPFSVSNVGPWFCYQLIAKTGNKTATVSWPDPSIYWSGKSVKFLGSFFKEIYWYTTCVVIILASLNLMLFLNCYFFYLNARQLIEVHPQARNEMHLLCLNIYSQTSLSNDLMCLEFSQQKINLCLNFQVRYWAYTLWFYLISAQQNFVGVICTKMSCIPWSGCLAAQSVDSFYFMGYIVSETEGKKYSVI